MTDKPNDDNLMDKLVALCRRRGFIFQSSEIYGGINGFWDYGPLGVELKRNIKDAWWTDIVRKRDDMVGLDAAIIMNPQVWQASGHTEGFTDPMVDCKECRARFRTDKVYHVPVMALDREILSVAVEADSLGEAIEISEEAIRAKARQQNIAGLKKISGRSIATIQPDRAFFTVVGRNQPYLVHVVLLSTEIAGGSRPCPRCGHDDSLTEPREFNLMFKTFVGAMEDSSAVAYLRPETAQGIFANYRNVLDTSRVKLPFGIAQIGKAFRNEINPRNFTFRSREFEQMEIEFFVHPDQADKWYEYWRQARFDWYVGLGLTSSKLHLRDHEADELAHYARACADIEYEFPFGIAELEGVANRTDYDLKAHQDRSGRDLTYFDEDAWDRDAAKFSADNFDGDKKAAREAAGRAKQAEPYRFIPYVIEPSGGVDRAALAFLCEAYTEDEAPDDKGKMQQRVVMKLHPRLAPIKAAVFPLVKRDGMPETARAIYEDLQAAGLACSYDEKGAIGRRYRRQDEAGTPFCITVDGQTAADGSVTVRQRDTLKQDRIDKSGVPAYVREHLGA